ncbi:MAG: O-antigen translocase [Flavobacterium sp.]|nr:O-antigen translocase [Flavobacterium sp.]
MFKITSLNSLSVLVKIGVGVVSSKVMAVFVGPSGLALVGNFRNFITSIETVSTLGLQNGVVKYVVDAKDDAPALQKVLATVFISLAVMVVLLSAGLLLFAHFWSDWLFGPASDYQAVILALALALPWYAASILLVSVLNGLGQFKQVIRVNLWGNLIGLLTSLLLVWQYKTYGALLSLVLPPALLFVVVVYYLHTKIQFAQLLTWRLFDKKILRQLASFSLMALVATVLGPLVYVQIRNLVITQLGTVQAGYWEAMTRISSYYFMFVATLLSVYFLPKLSQAKTNKATQHVFFAYYKLVLPLFVLGLFILYLGRNFWVPLLFSKAFVPVTDLFFWQMVGDVFKAASLILGYQFFAKKMTVAFIFCELASLGAFYICTLICMPRYQLQGVVMAQAMASAGYFFLLVGVFCNQLLAQENK